MTGDLPTQAEPYSLGQADADATVLSPKMERAGTIVGRYHLLRQLGEGGFGTVWEADQTEPVRRRVAMKILKPGMDSRQILARFEAERQALALMDHQNIARVLDAGATDTGRPYFVMELVRGVPITEYCERERVTLSERLRLFRLVCEAVQHAHTKGVIHRDLKPSNILVMMQDYRPTPKVIDFGIAKATTARLTERTLYTEHGQLIGTPEYMSPEQAENTGIDVDTRSDVYSLGVVLYELITGTTPFNSERLRSSSHNEIQRIIREDVPEAPSVRLGKLAEAAEEGHQRNALRRLARAVRGDLDWIVMRAMEKDRTRRYEAVAAFSEDLRRHLAHESVSAGRPSTLHRFGKTVQRHRGPFLTGGLVLGALLLGTGATAVGMASSIAQRDAAEARAAAAEASAQALLQTLGGRLAAAANAELSGQAPSLAGPFDALALPGAGSAKGPAADPARLRAAASLIETGQALAAQGRFAEAEPLLSDGLAALEAIPGLDASTLLWTRLWLGAAQARTTDSLGRGRARATLEATLDDARETLGPDHIVTAIAAEELGLHLRRTSRPDEAAMLLQAAADGYAKALPVDHPWRARLSRLLPGS